MTLETVKTNGSGQTVKQVCNDFGKKKDKLNHNSWDPGFLDDLLPKKVLQCDKCSSAVAQVGAPNTASANSHVFGHSLCGGQQLAPPAIVQLLTHLGNGRENGLFAHVCTRVSESWHKREPKNI